MAQRKAIPKRIRFEVFKRDKFTCQYCGRMAPDVVLHVDHIKPVSKGGTNEIMNLVTSCAECNLGKTNIELSDDAIVKKQQEQLKLLAERKEQIEMMLKWKEGMIEIENVATDAIVKVFEEKTDTRIRDSAKVDIIKWLNQFTFQEVLDATFISINSYYDGSVESANISFNKIPGICFNKRRNNDKKSYYLNYTVKALNNKGYFCDRERIKEYIDAYVVDDEDFELVKRSIKASRSWGTFLTMLSETFETEDE